MWRLETSSSTKQAVSKARAWNGGARSRKHGCKERQGPENNPESWREAAAVPEVAQRVFSSGKVKNSRGVNQAARRQVRK